MARKARPARVAWGKVRFAGRLPYKRQVMNIGLPMAWRWGRRRACNSVMWNKWIPGAGILINNLGRLKNIGRLPIGRRFPTCPTKNWGRGVFGW